jgi:hypothetical protein
MADPITIQELLVSSLATSDAVAKLLIEKGFFTQAELIAKISGRRHDSINIGEIRFCPNLFVPIAWSWNSRTVSPYRILR